MPRQTRDCVRRGARTCDRIMHATADVTSKAYFEYLRAAFLPHACVKIGRRLFFNPLARLFQGRVLDVGCGVGHFLSVYPEAYGLDLNPYCVRYCLYQGFHAVEADARHLPFPEASFDGVLLSHVLEHLEEPHRALGDAVRVLKGGGTICIRVPTLTGYRLDRSHRTYLTYPVLAEMLEQLNCQVTEHRYYPIPWRLFGEIIIYNELRVVAEKVTTPTERTCRPDEQGSRSVG